MSYLPTKLHLIIIVTAAALIAAGVLLWLSLPDPQTAPTGMKVVGDKEIITILKSGKSIEAVAKIDTGADYSSIDGEFARSMGLKINPKLQKEISSAQGIETRDTVRLTFELGGRKIKSRFTVADRRGLSTLVLIGRRDLKGFVVDPAGSFLTRPPEANLKFADKHSPGLDQHRILLITVFPILGFFVALLRQVVGIRTYGIFGPVVIAFSLFETNIFQGILFYLFFVTLGIAVKLFVFNRFQLPHITELALIMFVLVAALVATVTLIEDFSFSFTAVFFPLIITSFLIERATKTIEEHRITDALYLLFSTIATALLLAILGKFLVTLDPAAVYAIFALSFLAVIAVGKYQGLRLSELRRFRFLRRDNAPH